MKDIYKREVWQVVCLCVISFLILSCEKEIANPEVIKPPVVVEPELPIIPPTVDDLKAYFDINTRITVTQMVKTITQLIGEKNINGKIININKCIVKSREDEAGRLIVDIEGTTNGKKFMREYAFEDLIKKPNNILMATRVLVRWKKEFAQTPEATGIAFDELFRLKQTEKFTAKYLAQWVEFYLSSSTNDDMYLYEDEDFEKIELSEINYDGNNISFMLTYDGIRGNKTKRLSLKFEQNEYYARKVKLDRDDTKKYYAQGVYEHLESFYRDAVSLETGTGFMLELAPETKHFDRVDNAITCQLLLKTYRDEELARLQFKFEGFKPLTDLKDEWSLVTTSPLNERMKNALKNRADGDVSEHIDASISNWIKLAQMSLRRNGEQLKLQLSTGKLNDIKVDAWIPESRRDEHLDILLLAPRFKLVSAMKAGTRLSMRIALIEVNETSLTDIVVPLEVTLL